MMDGGHSARAIEAPAVTAPTAPPARRRLSFAWAWTVVRVVAPLLSILGLWYLAIALSGLPSFVIPRPERVLATLLEDRAFITVHLFSTLQVAALGLLFANIAGIGMAMLFDAVPATRHMLMPAAITLRNMPYVALVTVLSLALGDTLSSKVTVVALAGFFPVLVNTMQGLRAADPVMLDRMRVLNAGWMQTFTLVRLPYAVPHIIAAQEIAATSSIPVIDVAGLYSPDLAERKRVAGEIGRACDEIGFFYAVGHHVKLDTIEAAWKKAQEFFAQPMEAKLAVECDRNNRGYRKMGDTIPASGLKFARDSFDLGFPCKADDPEVLAGTPLYAPNNWPDLPGFAEALSAYYQGSYEVGLTILRGFGLYLGQEEEFFARHFTRPVADMVINHYYPYAAAIGLGATETASGAHTDHGIITILWQDYSGGLQVMAKDGTYWDVPPIPGGYVINVGELMKRWTNGRFKATVHRVIHTKNAPRISMPLFCNPNFHTMVDPRQLGIAEEEAKYGPVQSGEFLIGRFQKTRKLWGAANKTADVKSEAVEAHAEV